jgi:hypothetical protein
VNKGKKKSKGRGCYYAPARRLVLCAFAPAFGRTPPFATRLQLDRNWFGYGAMRTRTDLNNQWNADLLWIPSLWVIELSALSVPARTSTT